MKFTKEAVEVITNQVVEFARNKGDEYTKHCVVAGLDGTPILYLMRKDGNIDNAWVDEQDQVCVEDFPAGTAFRSSIADLWLPLETKDERMLRKIRAKNDETVKSVLDQKGLIKDLHNNGSSNAQLTHVAKFGKLGQRESIVAIMGNNVFCLNVVTLNEQGVAELSTYSCGGNMNTRTMSAHTAAARYADMSGNQVWDLVRVDGQEDDTQVEALTISDLKTILANLPLVHDSLPIGTALRSGDLAALVSTQLLTDAEGKATGFLFNIGE
jgi:hypothetical protein